MYLIKHEPRFFFDDALDFLFLRPTPLLGQFSLPKIEVTEDKEKVKIKAALKGLDAKDARVSLKGDRLILKASFRQENKSKDKNRIFYQGAFREFRQELKLPAKVKGTTLKKTVKDGVLEIEIDKLKEKEK